MTKQTRGLYIVKVPPDGRTKTMSTTKENSHPRLPLWWPGVAVTLVGAVLVVRAIRGA